MTITLSVEEIRDFEKALGFWHTQQVLAGIGKPQTSFPGASAYAFDKKAMSDWIEKNPRPRLLPAV